MITIALPGLCGCLAKCQIVFWVASGEGESKYPNYQLEMSPIFFAKYCSHGAGAPRYLLRAVVSGVFLVVSLPARAGELPPAEQTHLFPELPGALGSEELLALGSVLQQSKSKYSPFYGNKDLLGSLGEPYSGERMLGMDNLIRLPSTFTVLFWVQLTPDARPSALFGMGDPNGGYLTLMKDSAGAPMLVILDKCEAVGVARAPVGAADLCDGKVHSIAIVLDRGASFVQMYVDGRAEVGSAMMGLPVMAIGKAFWKSTFVGLPDERNIFLPRIVGRALTPDELAALRPEAADSGDWLAGEIAGVRALEASLSESTLASFPLSMMGRRVIHNPPPSYQEDNPIK